MDIKNVLNMIKENQGGLVLSAIAFLFSLITGVILTLCGSTQTTACFSAQSAGFISIVIVNILLKVCNLRLSVGVEWGVIGTVLGTLITMITA